MAAGWKRKPKRSGGCSVQPELLPAIGISSQPQKLTSIQSSNKEFGN